MATGHHGWGQVTLRTPSPIVAPDVVPTLTGAVSRADAWAVWAQAFIASRGRLNPLLSAGRARRRHGAAARYPSPPRRARPPIPAGGRAAPRGPRARARARASGGPRPCARGSRAARAGAGTAA